MRCPTLVVAGGVDPVATVDAAAEMAAALPAHLVRFERFAGAGHHIHEDCPDRFFALLREFLTDSPATDARPPDAGVTPDAATAPAPPWTPAPAPTARDLLADALRRHAGELRRALAALASPAATARHLHAA